MSAAPQKSSIDPDEVARFSAMAEDWWKIDGKFAPLHKFNPVRLTFIRDVASSHFGRDPKARRPFEGLSLLDIGCGGGLLSEPMCRLGFGVTGVDASARNIGAASAHAASQSLAIDYRADTAEALLARGERFDVILNMEVIEHVADPGQFLRDTAAMLKPGGLMIVATLNRTLKSLALAKIGAEYVLRWVPAGTHDWNKFLKPSELVGFLDGAGVQVEGPFGVTLDIPTWTWKRSGDSDVNYMITVKRP